MTSIDKLILKGVGVGATLLIGYSLLWISLLYLYGIFYQPINDTFLGKIIPFDWFVILISVLIIYFIMKRGKKTLINIIIQDIPIAIISFPLFAMILSIFNAGLDDNVEEINPFWIMIVLTIFTININDWIKQRDSSNSK
jgi:hypothetical protein